jgi:hypothetical protein
VLAAPRCGRLASSQKSASPSCHARCHEGSRRSPVGSLGRRVEKPRERNAAALRDGDQFLDAAERLDDAAKLLALDDVVSVLPDGVAHRELRVA